jgi:hypothetical protein
VRQPCPSARFWAGIDAPYRTGRIVFPDGRVVYRSPENNPELVTGTDAESQKIISDIRSIYNRLPHDRRILAVISGAFHFTFSDDAILKSRLMLGLLRVFGKLKISGPRQLEITAYSVRTFFDRTLKGAQGAVPDLRSPAFPELRILE